MTRNAVREGFVTFLDDAIEATAQEFSVTRTLREGTRGPGGALVDRMIHNSDAVHRHVVEPELETYRTHTLEQFDRLLDAVTGGDPIADHRGEILRVGTFTDAIRADLEPSRRQQVRDDLFAHHEALGRAVEPLVEAPESSFWEAATAVYTRDQAERLVTEHFAFTGPLRNNRAAFEMRTAVDVGSLLGGLGSLLGSASTVEVEYTDEAIRAMCRAEQAVVREATREIDRQFE